MVEDSRLGGARGVAIVVRGDRVQELGERVAVEPGGALLDQPQPEVDVAEQAPFLGRREKTGPGSARASGRRRAGARPRAGGRRAAADGAGRSRGKRRHADGVLEQSAGVGVVGLGRAGTRAGSPRRRALRDVRREPGMRRPRRRGTRGILELLGVAAQRGVSAGRIDVAPPRASGLELEAVAEALDASEHAHRVPLAEAAVEQLDVVPDPASIRPRRVDELEREVRRAALRA